MKEKLYTIPVSEAFEADCECPVCEMRHKLETNAIEFTMGPSYMEDDIRGMTSQMGFCEKHLVMLYQNQNRLGLALILKTQMDKMIKDIEKLSSMDNRSSSSSLFRKKSETSEVTRHLQELSESCFVCDRINQTMKRYIATIFHLFHTEEAFRAKFKASKGFCTSHYHLLYEEAPKYLGKEELDTFTAILNELYLENMRRVRDDLEWFINKFDYRFAEEPWKNAKDALPRAMQKVE